MSVQLHFNSTYGQAPVIKARWFDWQPAPSASATSFAHPWSAYRPETYLAGSPPSGIVLATKAAADAQKFPTSSAQPKENAHVTHGPSQPHTTSVGSDVELAVVALLPPPIPTVPSSHPNLANKLGTSLTTGDIVAELEEARTAALNDAAENASKQQAQPIAQPSRHLQDRHLPARLQSVAHLNVPKARAVRHIAGSAAHAPVRRRVVTPPAIQPKSRRSATIIQLDAVLHRRQHTRNASNQAA